MRLRRDWLANVLTVPYVPTLGAVHPGAVTPDLFEAVVDASGTGRFLSHDAGRRWARHKDEAVLVDHLDQSPDHTAIVTLTRRRGGQITVYYYARQPPDLPAVCERAQKLRAEYGVDTGRVVWFQRTPPLGAAAACTRVLLRTITGAERGSDPAAAREVFTLDACPPAVSTTSRSETLTVPNAHVDEPSSCV